MLLAPFAARRSATALSALAVAAAAFFVFAPRSGPDRHATPAPSSPGTARGPLPCAFVENRGQWPTAARFVAQLRSMVARLEPGAIVLDLPAPGPDRQHGVLLRLVFENARADAALAGKGLQPGVHHFLRGRDPAQWRRFVRGFDGARYRALWDGVDLDVRTVAGELEYDLSLAPHADLDLVCCRVEGGSGLRIDADGALVIATPFGELRQPVPRTWEVTPDGAPRGIACRYVVRDAQRFGFAVDGRDPNLALVIDPGLLWATYLGAVDDDQGVAADFDAAGDLTVAGTTLSPAFPVTPGVHGPTYSGGSLAGALGDAFVARIAGATGQLVFATYLGGSDGDVLVTAQAVSGREIIAAGWTLSVDFPTTPGAFDPTYNGPFSLTTEAGGDLFVTRLRADGSDLAYSTYIGGLSIEYVSSAYIDRTEAVTMSGHVHSLNFPTTPGAFSRLMQGRPDAYLTRLDPTGSALAFSTFYGGRLGEEYGLALQVDAAGVTTLAGATNSSDLPTTPGAFDVSYNGGTAHWADGFVARFDATGSNLLYGTFLGGPGDDSIVGIALEPGGEVTATGQTSSPAFPTTPGAFDPSFGGMVDAFVTRLDAQGSSLLWSTLLGGGDKESGKAIRADGTGAVVVSGHTLSPAFPVTPGAYDTTWAGGWEVFVTVLDPTGSRMRYGTFLGGRSFETAVGLALDGAGGCALFGTTTSRDFPATKGAFDPTYNGGAEAFAARLDLLPTGVSRYGTATPVCGAAPLAGVTAMPQVGAAAFGFTCGSAPASTGGALLLGSGALATPLPLLGALLWVDPGGAAVLLLPATSDQLGAAEVALPIPGNPALAGAVLHAQFLWAVPAACPESGLGASGALRLVVQP